MECQECHQNPATIHFTQVINGEKNEIHVCEKCAIEKGYIHHKEEPYSLHHLLSGLFQFDTDLMQQNQPDKKPALACDNCGMTYRQFAKIGKFGCSQCYATFNKRLNPLLRRVHGGNTMHEGKIPKRQGTSIYQRKQLRDMRENLRKLIEEEAFEQAAEVRDQIKALEKTIGHSEEGEQDGT